MNSENDKSDPTNQTNETSGISQPPYPYPPPYYYPEDEDEINLLDLLIVLLKYKILIVAIVFLAGAEAVIYSLKLDNIYRSEATIIARQQESGTSSALSALGGFGGLAGNILGLGGGGSLDKFQTVLNSRIFARKIYNEHKLDILPGLYEEDWDAENKKWADEVEEPPTIQDLTKAISELLNINAEKKTGVLTIQVDHTDPAYAKKMVEYYIKQLSDSLRAETLKDAAENQEFLSEQIEKTSDVLLKEKIYALLAKEIEKETFARAQDPYSFQVLDPPIVPDLNKKVKPKRSMICMLTVIVAFFFAVFLAFFIEYIQNTRKSEDPERIERFKDSLRFKPK